MISRYRVPQLVLLLRCSKSHVTRQLATLSTFSSQQPKPITSHESFEVSSSFQPLIRKNPFTPNVSNMNILDIPKDILPNPIINMNIEQLGNLTKEEYIHLHEISYGNQQEIKEICLKISEFIKTILLLDPKRANWMYRVIKDNELQLMIQSEVFKFFKNHQLELSIWFFITKPRLTGTHERIRTNIKSIFESDISNKSDALLNYLSKLVKTDIINPTPILLNHYIFENLITTVSIKDHGLLYLYMFQINLQSQHKFLMDKWKRNLLSSSSLLNQYIVQTGYIPPIKYQDLPKFEISNLQKSKMIHFLNISDFENFINKGIKSNQPLKSIFYLNCMLEKFEKKCMISNNKIKGDSNIKQDVEILLRCLINIIMKFKGAYHCIDILKYMANENLKPGFDIYLLLLKNLRELGNFNEFIVVLNHMKLDSLKLKEKLEFSDEILALMEARFPNSPKVIIGYIGAIYGKKGLSILNRLKLLSIPYGSNGINEIPSTDVVQIATVDDRLKGLTLNYKSLGHVYQVVLNSIVDLSKSPNTILKLYHEYQNYLNEISTGSSSNIRQQDTVITVLLNHLLRTDEPITSTNLPISSSLENYEVAKIIANTYYFNINHESCSISSMNIELLIQTALLKHQDYQFAFKMLQISRKFKRPFTFNQIYPFIKYHFDNKNYEDAKIWYNELMKLGAISQGIMMSDLLRMARKLNWNNIELRYKLNLGMNQKKNKLALHKLQLNPLLINTTSYLTARSIDDEITDDIISNCHEEEEDYEYLTNKDFGSELASVLCTF